MSRADFRQACVERDGGECVVPSCEKSVTVEPSEAGEVHHIIERKLWDDGGYFTDNGACVCNEHHRLAESNIIPPQAFWRWVGVEDPTLPDSVDSRDVNKWGKELDVPPWREHRERIKYPSTRHLPFSHERDADDTAHESVDAFLNMPLVATVKMDGSNAMLVADADQPVRARNGRHADKEHFDMAKQWYWDKELYEKIPDHIQVFGEWLYAKHSIHYGCDCTEQCEDVGPALSDYFQMFGAYDTRYDIWLGWEETCNLAQELEITTAPAAWSPAGHDYDRVYEHKEFDNRQKFWDEAWQLSQKVVDDGHEGIVIRSALPFHYSQIGERLGKYVRPGHVKEDEKHWSKRRLVQNNKQ